MNPKPFWQSVTFYSAVFTALAALLGEDLAALLVDPNTAESAAHIGLVLGTVFTMWGRWRASSKLTLTKPKKDDTNA